MEINLGHFSLMKTQRTGRILLDIADVMRRHQHGAPARDDRREQLHDPVCGGGIEVAGRLVGENHLRVVQQGPGDRQPLLFAARQLERHLILLVLQAYHVEHFGDLAADLQFVFPPGRLQHEMQVLKNVPVGQQLVILKHDSDPAPKVRHVFTAHPPQAEPDDHPASFAQRQFGVKRLEQRTLARPDPADQIDQFAGKHRQIDIRQHHIAGSAVTPETGLPQGIVEMENRHIP